jgi:predicted alpha/beta hydrolase family esterase
MKRVVIAHGWGDSPEKNWFPWVRRELEARGFAVIAPQLPEPEEPRVETWVPALATAVGTADAETYFVGHSMGCQTIARYLAGLPAGTQVGGVVYVAGFFKRLTNLEGPPEETLWETWRATPIDFDKLKECAPKSVAIFSDDDPFVPLDNVDGFRALGSEIIIEHAKGHFTTERGITELSEALAAVLKIAKN